MILFSLVTSFILAPSSSEEEEGVGAEASRGVDEEDAEARGGGGAGVRRSWREPSGGADRGSGGRWAIEEEEEVGSSTEDVGPGVGDDETRFSLLSLPSVSVTPARGCKNTLVWLKIKICHELPCLVLTFTIQLKCKTLPGGMARAHR